MLTGAETMGPVPLPRARVYRAENPRGEGVTPAPLLRTRKTRGRVALIPAPQTYSRDAERSFGVSTSGYYAWKGRNPSRRQLDDMVLLAHIRSQFRLSHETYGSPRMTVELREDGIAVGRHRVARLMRENGLKAVQRRRFKKTTDSAHGGPVALNVLDQDFAADGPDQKWGADISYIWTAEGGCIWRSSSTCSPDASSAGPPVTA